MISRDPFLKMARAWMAALLVCVSAGAAEEGAVRNVLDLDGVSGYVELPPKVFESMRQGTVEGWIKWRGNAKWVRFWDYGRANDTLHITQQQNQPNMFTLFFRSPGPEGAIDSPLALRLERWSHLAAVTGPGGQKLYVDGELVGARPERVESFAAVTPGGNARLGRDCWGGDAFTRGQMAEVRVWDTQRTAEEIRGNMFRPMAGNEPGLRALWNFADPLQPARDATSNRFDGALKGGARIVQEKLPTALDHVSPLVIKVTVRDEAGSPATGAMVVSNFSPAGGAELRSDELGEAEQWVYPGGEAYRARAFTANSKGETVKTVTKDSPGKIDILLKKSVSLSGQILSLDGATPLARVIVQVVPDGAEEHREIVPVGTPRTADAEVLTQVLENLVSNAVKYSPAGKNIFLRVGSAEAGIRCEVRDEGPGLTAEDQKKLFGKFARLSAKPTGGENATGLGLSIVKKMVEAMSGRIWCESSPGQGATFVLMCWRRIKMRRIVGSK